MNDPLLVSFIGGALGTLADDVIHWSAVYFKIANSTSGHYLSQLFFPNEKVTLPKLLMGEFAHLLAGGTFGVTIYIMFMLFGDSYLIWKGAGFGAVMWIVHVGIVPNMVAPRPFIRRTYSESVIDLLSHIVWGGITAWFIISFL